MLLIAQDPFDANTIYYGSQFVHKSTDMGNTWSIISPDLTTNDPDKQRQLESGGLTYDVTQAENFTTIVAISPSEIDPDVIWVGTDDGHVQVTRDGGQSWENVIDNIKGVAEGSWVPQIHASKHAPGEAYVVFEDHRRNNWEPYLYRTRNYGERWERLVDNEDVWGYALSFAQDPITPNLLFLGTEFGLYVSVDEGDSWHPFKHGYPTSSTMDMAIHPRDHDLVVGTFGRSIYVIDDIRPLRAVAQNGTDFLEAPLTLFEIPDAYLSVNRQAAGTRFAADGMFAGENREYGAMISYWVHRPSEAVATAVNTSVDESGPSSNADSNETGSEEQNSEDKKKPSVKIEILDESGDVIRTLKGPAKPGLNRTYWKLRQKGARFSFNPFGEQNDTRDEEPAGAQVLPGSYTVRIGYDDHTSESQINVLMDPRLQVGTDGLEERIALFKRWETHATIITEAADRLRDAQKTINGINERIGDSEEESTQALKSQGDDLNKKLDQFKEQIVGKDVQGIRRDPNTLISKLFLARRYITSGFNAPDPGTLTTLSEARDQLSSFITDFNAFFAEEWVDYQNAVDEANISLFDDIQPLSLEETGE